MNDIFAIRTSLGFKQREMAASLGMSLRGYQELESQSNPPLRYMLASERLALETAVRRKDISLAPANVRKDALDLARLITG